MQVYGGMTYAHVCACVCVDAVHLRQWTQYVPLVFRSRFGRVRLVLGKDLGQAFTLRCSTSTVTFAAPARHRFDCFITV